MGLKVVGAGVGRTGTHSLKIALERLLGRPCYHMTELFPRPQHVPMWLSALRGEEPDWSRMLEEFSAAVDWPAAALWQELHRAFPESLVVLSVRDDAEAWWESFSQTILQVMRREPAAGMEDWHAMSRSMLERLTPSYADHAAAVAAYEAHNDRVRASVDPGRLIEWRPSDGWGPLCAGLGLPQPGDPFPHVNTAEEFRSMAGLTGERP